MTTVYDLRSLAGVPSHFTSTGKEATMKEALRGVHPLLLLEVLL